MNIKLRVNSFKSHMRDNLVTNKSSLHINLSKTTIVDRKPILYHNQWEEESKEMQEGRD